MKDVADLREIAVNTRFNWVDTVIEAREREAGLELPLLSQILPGVPRDRLDSIKWVNPPTWDEFMADLEIKAYDMLSGEDNSLCGRKV
jgi:hypothetical protein